MEKNNCLQVSIFSSSAIVFTIRKQLHLLSFIYIMTICIPNLVFLIPILGLLLDTMQIWPLQSWQYKLSWNDFEKIITILVRKIFIGNPSQKKYYLKHDIQEINRLPANNKYQTQKSAYALQTGCLWLEITGWKGESDFCSSDSMVKGGICFLQKIINKVLFARWNFRQLIRLSNHKHKSPWHSHQEGNNLAVGHFRVNMVHIAEPYTINASSSTNIWNMCDSSEHLFCRTECFGSGWHFEYICRQVFWCSLRR